MPAGTIDMDKERILINSFSQKYNQVEDNFGSFSLEDAKETAERSLEYVSEYLGGEAEGAQEAIESLSFEDLKEGTLGQYVSTLMGPGNIDISKESEDDPKGFLATVHETYHAAKDYASREIENIYNKVRNYFGDETETEKGTLKVVSDMAAEGDEKAEVAAYNFLRNSAIVEELYDEVVESGRDPYEVKEELYHDLEGISKEEYDEIFDLFMDADNSIIEEYTVEPYREVLENLEFGEESLELVGQEQEASNLFDMIDDAVKTYSERIKSYGENIYDYVMDSEEEGMELEPAPA